MTEIVYKKFHKQNAYILNVSFPFQPSLPQTTPFKLAQVSSSISSFIFMTQALTQSIIVPSAHAAHHLAQSLQLLISQSAVSMTQEASRGQKRWSFHFTPPGSSTGKRCPSLSRWTLSEVPSSTSGRPACIIIYLNKLI